MIRVRFINSKIKNNLQKDKKVRKNGNKNNKISGVINPP